MATEDPQKAIFVMFFIVLANFSNFGRNAQNFHYANSFMFNLTLDAIYTF